jgi:hypothetical protein
VPVKLILVKLDDSVYPVLADTPEVFENLRVVPEGGLTRPTVTNKVDDATNPEIENPGAFWFEVFWLYEVAVGDITLCALREKTEKNIIVQLIILFRMLLYNLR